MFLTPVRDTLPVLPVSMVKLASSTTKKAPSVWDINALAISGSDAFMVRLPDFVREDEARGL
ncbi:hypothetical protein [Phaeobacter phage MD18]|nr:hypothetical protein [Phaeobacter phage MD18]